MQERNEERKNRFEIEKLEERIAPSGHCHGLPIAMGAADGSAGGALAGAEDAAGGDCPA